jgi:hypothetical protein
MSTNTSIDTVENRTCDLPACSAVPQPNGHSVSQLWGKWRRDFIMCVCVCLFVCVLFLSEFSQSVILQNIFVKVQNMKLLENLSGGIHAVSCWETGLTTLIFSFCICFAKAPNNVRVCPWAILVNSPWSLWTPDFYVSILEILEFI